MIRTDLKSTVLQYAIYHQPAAVLELRFRDGALYRYFDVPAPTFEHLVQAESNGRFFIQHIRDRFRFTRVDTNRAN